MTTGQRFTVHLLPVILCLCLLCMLLSCGCSTQESDLRSLEAVEVRNYQGERLDSIGDFRENSLHGPQYVNLTDYRLAINGLVREPRNYTYDQVTSGFPSYRKVVTLDCVEGWDVRILWEGVLLSDLIASAGPEPAANTVIFTAVDGYTSSLPLDYLVSNRILLAYRINNVTLPAERGFPFQVVAEDRWGYKWVKWVTAITLSDDPKVRGYWEDRGFSESGLLNRSYLFG
ncbi:MAG: molybdopterin-dependent oxidoreductase [Methanomicrobiales archaeon]|nr:molybdopterin-dependent oxidoreductase [Methanomicrobiales archaeon]